MTTVTVSRKFQITIPRSVRESMKLHVGQKLGVFAYNGQIHLLPVVPIQEFRGVFRGLDPTIPDEPDREF